MKGVVTRPPTAAQIDKACRLGQFVFFFADGRQQAIAGASTHHRNYAAGKDYVFVSVLPSHEWRQVKASDVVITDKTLKGDSEMETATETGTRRRGRPRSGDGKETADLGTDARLVSEEPDGQKRLDGMERVADPEIEAQAEKVKALENKRKAILEKEVEQRAILTKMMRDKKVNYYPLGGDLEGYVAEIETEPKAKIHKAKKKADDEDDDD